MAEPWSNWSETVRCHPAERLTPASETEVADAVARAAADGRCVRVAGSGHSHTPLVATDGSLLSLERLAGLVSVDARRREARVRAGTVLRDLGEPLRAAGLAQSNLGDVDVQALAGALATGTHGTGRRLGGLATQLRGLRLVDATGRVLACDPATEPELFACARVSLGALGVLTEVTLALEPAFRLHERIVREDVDTCLARFDERADRHRHCEFFWWPGRDRADVKTLKQTSADPDPLAERRYERIDHSHRVLPSPRPERFVEMEYALPEAEGPACFRALRARMQQHHPDVQWPVEYRSVAADDVPLSPAFGRATVTISVHQGAGLPYERCFADAEAIFREHAGRPHWGKCHGLGASELASLYPEWERFLALRRRLDPDGLFLNDALRALFGL